MKWNSRFQVKTCLWTYAHNKYLHQPLPWHSLTGAFNIRYKIVNYINLQQGYRSGPEVIKLFSHSIQLSMKISLLLNMKMPTIHIYITKTRLYNFDLLKPHFYIVKLGFTGVYIIFLFSAQKHRLWVPVRTASVPKIYVLSRYMKNIRIFYLKFFFFWVYNFQYIWIGGFS